MGWGGGTEIFDTVLDQLLNSKKVKKEVDVEELVARLYDVLRDHDWDVVDESGYYDHPVVVEILKEREPGWFEDEEDL